MEKIAGWRHSGFSAHSKVRAEIKEEAERVGKYMIRPLLPLERLSFSEKEEQEGPKLLIVEPDIFILLRTEYFHFALTYGSPVFDRDLSL